MGVVNIKTKQEIEDEKNAPKPPSEIELLQEKVVMQDTIIEELMFVIIPELAGGIGGE